MASRSLDKDTIQQLKALAEGIPKYCPNATFQVADQTFTATEVVTLIGVLLSAVSAVQAAVAALGDARLKETAAVAQHGAILTGIKQTLAIMFSANLPALSAFDIRPRKPRTPMTSAQRATMEAKAAATRLARGTRSKKATAKITGNVTGVTITPITTGTAATTPTTASTASLGAAATGSSSASPAASGTVTASPVTTGTAAATSHGATPGGSAAHS